MYINSINNSIEKRPSNKIKLEHPNVSFPFNISDSLLEHYGIFKINNTDQPIIADNQILEEGLPELVDGVWTQTWIVRDLDEGVLKQRRINELKQLLEDSDYKDLPNYKPKEGELIEEVIAQRDAWREEIRVLESEINK